MTVTSFTTAIAHVPTDPARSGWLPQILARLDGYATVCEDIDGYRLANYRRCWDVAQTALTTHLLCLADDMMPAPNFREHLDGALAARPESIICLFSMRGVILQARKQGVSWVDTPNCAWGGAMVMPCPWWREFRTWEQAHVYDDADHQSDDTRIALWAAATGRRILLTAPTLVEHVGAGRSTIGHSNRRRVSPWLADGARIEWTVDAISATRCNRGDPAWLKPDVRA